MSIILQQSDNKAPTSPTSISKMSTPSPHQSTARVYDGSVRTSGARNSGVPQKVEVRSPKPIPSLQSPKSATLTNPSASSNKLSSFKSLHWTQKLARVFLALNYTRFTNKKVNNVTVVTDLFLFTDFLVVQMAHKNFQCYNAIYSSHSAVSNSLLI